MKRVLILVLFLICLPRQALADSLTVYGDTCDIEWTSIDTNSYAVARNIDSCFWALSENQDGLGQMYWGSSIRVYYVERGGLKFDTSPLPDNASISACTLFICNWSLQITEDCGHFDVCVVNGYFDCPMDGSKWDEMGMGIGASKNTSTFPAILNYIAFELDSLQWISKTEATYFGLRSKNDIDSIPSPDGQEMWFRVSANYSGQDYDPYLKIYYTVEEDVMRIKDDWRFTTHFMRDWRFQNVEEWGITPTLEDGEILKILENGEVAHVVGKQ